MKILVVSSEFPPGPGGIGRHAADFSLALACKGYTVNVYSNLDYANRETVQNFINELHPLIKLYPFKRVGIFTYPLRIIKILNAVRKESYNRLVFTGKFPLWIGAIIKVLYGKRKNIEFFVHGSEINPGGIFSLTLTHWALYKADLIWAVSKFSRSILPEKIKNKKEIRIMPNGIHPNQWPSPDAIEHYSGWKGCPKLLTVGSISPRKGQHRVIKALPELIEKFPDIHYHIVGMDSNAGYLRDLINKLKLNDFVTFHGFVADKKDLASAYKTCDIFIMLSENQTDGDVEGFGISILEANFYGLPAIGALGCGIEDAIKPGVNGELVEGGNSSEIVKAVVKILNHKNQYIPGLSEWIAKHDWNLLINNFLSEV